MNKRRSIIINVIWIVIGAGLIVASKLSFISDLYIGFGGGLLGVGVIQLARLIKYKTNDDYREKLDVELGDERNHYISMKAWSWAGYMFVIIAAVISIICMILSLTVYMQIASGAVCLMIVLYYVSYLILKKKY